MIYLKNNKILKSSAIILCSSCCSVATDCPSILFGPTPYQMKLSFYNIDLAGGCYTMNCVNYVSAHISGVPDVNQEFILTQREDNPCAYRYTQHLTETPIILKMYYTPVTDCTEPATLTLYADKFQIDCFLTNGLMVASFTSWSGTPEIAGYLFYGFSTTAFIVGGSYVDNVHTANNNYTNFNLVHTSFCGSTIAGKNGSVNASKYS